MTEVTTPPKTKTLGVISAEKVKKIAGFTDWQKASVAFQEARKASATAKQKVKDALKKKLGIEGDVDFSIEGDALRVFEVFTVKKDRAASRVTDLSDKI